MHWRITDAVTHENAPVSQLLTQSVPSRRACQTRRGSQQRVEPSTPGDDPSGRAGNVSIAIIPPARARAAPAARGTATMAAISHKQRLGFRRGSECGCPISANIRRNERLSDKSEEHGLALHLDASA